MVVSTKQSCPTLSEVASLGRWLIRTIAPPPGVRGRDRAYGRVPARRGLAYESKAVERTLTLAAPGGGGLGRVKDSRLSLGGEVRSWRTSLWELLVADMTRILVMMYVG